MLQSDVNISEADSKNKQEARKILVSSENHENETDTSVFDWKKENAKWLKKRKKLKKPEILDERGRGDSLDIGKAKMIERLCEGFKPAMLLSDDGNLKNKNQFKADIDKYTKYNRQMLDELPEGLYFDLFCSFCDPDMKMKLSNIKDIEKMKPEKIWEQVELMFLTSNPIHTRRI